MTMVHAAGTSQTPVLLVATCLLLAAQLGIQQADASDSLKVITFARVHGCPLTVYYHNASRCFYLAPTLCIANDSRSLRTGAILRKDEFIGGFYLNIPVLITDSQLLTDSQRTLEPLLRDRPLKYLQPMSSWAPNRWGIPMVLWDSGEETGHFRVPCQQERCHSLVSQLINGEFHPFEGIPLTTTVRVLGQLVDLQQSVSFAYQSQAIHRQSSRTVSCKDMCANLVPYETVSLNQSLCHATVLRSSYQRAHFVVEPVFCYEGQWSTHLGGNSSSIVALTLETHTEQFRHIIKRKLRSALRIEFLNLVGAKIRVSTILSARWTFEPLRLAADGSKLELRILCDNYGSREELITILQKSPSDFLRHVNFRLESRLSISSNSFCTWRSHVAPLNTRVADVDAQSKLSDYHPIDGLLCIRPAFKRLLAPMPDSLCAILCSGESDCQAFSTAGGSCELFLFNKCSLNVRECGCTRRGRIFVRRRGGLEPGKLCPSGFGHDLCGVKYKLTEERLDWDTARRRSESQPGLVIMADAINKFELQHFVRLYSDQDVSSVWLGGCQRPGSAEPAGGWFWASCNRSVSMSSELWRSGEPNDRVENENVIEIGSYSPKFTDFRHDYDWVFGFLSECVSPF